MLDPSSPLTLICPRCRHLDAHGNLHQAPLKSPDSSEHRSEASLQEYRCTSCRATYPVVHDIPALFRDAAALSPVTNPPWSLHRLPVTTQIALLEGTAPGQGLYDQAARLARYLVSAFPEYLEGHPSPPTAPSHGAQLMRWLEKSGESQGCLRRGILGCGTAREAFEARQGSVVLLDAHFATLLAVRDLIADGTLSFAAPVGIRRWTAITLRVPPPTQPVLLLCADLLDPPLQARCMDRILLPNILDSISDPYVALGQAHALLSEGGWLTVSSPFTWRQEITPRERWLDGDGSATEAEWIEGLLSQQFQPGLRRVEGTTLDWQLSSQPGETLLYHNQVLQFRA